jgi:2,3-bisphosphoglycerate-dependent phosphoglycerate mutase
MAVGIKVGSITDEIGTSDFFHAFYSTVSGRLEAQWGERFPSLMHLYDGKLPCEQAPAALAELADIRSKLAAFPPDRVIWDIEDRAKMPPWGSNISADITNLSNYFVTSTGRDLIDLLHEALEASRDEQRPAEIVRY